MKSPSGKSLLLALAASTLLVASSGQPRHSVPFIPDNYPGALAEARAKKLPIFVEAWAPW